ncbi:hypothetical protein M9H77_18088 [Catharanthus roseus]|uniref:Uncharacterized protein n=1 Tax=Catharanthus roseus TaxID=4058 RepID=A0ACC0B6H3_CATRO|nr:hypothetical protein M9H77_18088 [Catharanthus roseus]
MTPTIQNVVINATYIPIYMHRETMHEAITVRRPILRVQFFRVRFFSAVTSVRCWSSTQLSKAGLEFENPSSRRMLKLSNKSIGACYEIFGAHKTVGMRSSWWSSALSMRVIPNIESKRKQKHSYSITNGFFAFNVLQNKIQINSKTEKGLAVNNIKERSDLLPRDPSGLGNGANSKSRTSPASSASVSAKKDSPKCSFDEEQCESLSNQWPQNSALKLSQQGMPFPLTAVTHAVTRGLTGTDQR